MDDPPPTTRPTAGGSSHSGRLSREIYNELGASGLSKHTTRTADEVTVDRVATMLGEAGCREVLDAGCGYGRIALPLADRAFRITGVDISPAMLRSARQREQERRLDVDSGTPVRWLEGDLCALPLDDAVFDAAICMWLTFNELLESAEQLAALRELHRVLRPGGWALIDGPPFMEHQTSQPQDNGQRTGGAFASVPPSQSPVGRRYMQLAEAAEITSYELLVDDCPGRPRYFFRFWQAKGVES